MTNRSLRLRRSLTGKTSFKNKLEFPIRIKRMHLLCNPKRRAQAWRNTCTSSSAKTFTRWFLDLLSKTKSTSRKTTDLQTVTSFPTLIKSDSGQDDSKTIVSGSARASSFRSQIRANNRANLETSSTITRRQLSQKISSNLARAKR